MRRLMRTTIALALIFTCFVFGSSVGVAQVEEIAIGNTFGLGARTMGMGGAFLAVADDYTTLYWNPAGLAQIRKFELFGSLITQRAERSKHEVHPRSVLQKRTDQKLVPIRLVSSTLYTQIVADLHSRSDTIVPRILIQRLLLKDWIRLPTWSV